MVQVRHFVENGPIRYLLIGPFLRLFSKKLILLHQTESWCDSEQINVKTVVRTLDQCPANSNFPWY